jgi:hypothetical protein
MPTYDLIVGAYMPNLENIKKQANLILRWHREGHYPVAAQIRGHLPRFLNMPDSEILAASFKLSDAQEIVARQQGFDSWQALKSGLPTSPLTVKGSPLKASTSKSSQSKATIVGAEPQLLVRDIKRSCKFFCEKLGFALVFSYGKPPYYAQVGRDVPGVSRLLWEYPLLAWQDSWRAFLRYFDFCADSSLRLASAIHPSITLRMPLSEHSLRAFSSRSISALMSLGLVRSMIAMRNAYSGCPNSLIRIRRPFIASVIACLSSGEPSFMAWVSVMRASIAACAAVISLGSWVRSVSRMATS